MTARAKKHGAAGQVLVIGFDGTEMSPRLAALLTRLQPAGVILFARNIQNPEQTWRLLRDCRQCISPPLLTCVDLEGGSVDRFRDVLGSTPSAAEVFATGSRRLFRKHGQIIGENCRDLGFNVDFAPAVDLAFEASRPVMGSRAVSCDPHETVTYAREFLAGLSQSRVLGCGKHFPGLGEGKLDSHHDLPVIEKPMKELWPEDLFPYRALRQHMPFVMVSHAAYPQITGDRTPASLSKKWISEILRQRIGYRGLVISDDLEMEGVLSAAPVGKAAVEFIRSGGDLCLICHHEDHIEGAYEALAKAAERDPNFTRRMAESVRRIDAFKKKSAKFLRAAKSPTVAVAEKLSRQLWEFSEQVRLARLKRGDKVTTPA